MGTFKIFGMILIGLFCAIFVFAQTQRKDEEVPAWMELISDGGAKGKYLIPKGAKVRQVGSQVIIETPNEYMARRFYELDERLTKIEQEQKIYREELTQMKEVVVSGLQQLLSTMNETK